MGGARVQGAEAGEEAAVLGRRKEPALSSAPCPFPAASAAAVTAVTAVPGAAGPTMQGGGPRGASIHSPSQGAGRARGSGGGRARPAEIRAHLSAGEGNRGRERVVQRKGGRVPSCHCSSGPSASPPREPSGPGLSRRRARPHSSAGSRWLRRRPPRPRAAPCPDSLGWPARTLRGCRARLGEVWELQPAPPVGLLAAHFRVWTVTRRAAQAEGTQSISPVSLGHLPTLVMTSS